MIVMKFGGSSVANKEQIDKVLEIVKARKSRRPFVVSSAHKGITNALVAAAKAAAAGEPDASKVINIQSDIAKNCGCPAGLLDPFFDELTDLLRGISLLRELSTRSLDYVSSFGERMSCRVIADYFTRKGLKSQAWDIWDLGFTTDRNFGAARPLPGYERAMETACHELIPHDVTPIITGFVGKTESGEITTVGRNGSDLTATLLAAALGADECEIWSDTDGVLTADPSIVPQARSIPFMRFDEAAELAYFGGRVLHPSTLVPAIKRNIPVRVLNTNKPDHPGSVIAEETPANPDTVTSIAYKEGQVVLSISSERMFGQSGFLARVFEVLGRHNVVIDMIATSEVSVSMTTDKLDNLNKAIKELDQFGKCQVFTERTIMVVVGQRLATTRGIGGKIMTALADAGVNAEMVSYGRGSINFTTLIEDKDVKKAVVALHKMLFER